jgi:small subunit ribosomal protein S21
MIKVENTKGNIEWVLKQYKSKIIKTRQMKELNDRREFEKPSVINRKKKQKAIYVNKKKNND